MIGTAVVVGGGIGGLATAVGLSRGGWDVRVFEQAAAFAPVGAGLGLGPNAVAALDWLGVGDRVRAIGRAPNQAGIRASNGPWLLRLDPAEVEAGRVYWFGCPAAPAGSYEHETLHEVAARFAEWHHPIPQLLAATPPESLIRSDVYYFPSRLPTYVSGRVVLLGDAAHAPTPDIGQGAGFAIEDAVVLAAALGEHDDLRLALGIYDEARRPRTQRLARLSGRLGRLLEGRTALGATVRNAMARVMPPRLALRATQDMFAWRPPA